MDKKTINQSQNSERLAEAGLRARQHIPMHKPGHSGRVVEIHKLRGRIGEELAQEEIQGTNINDLTGKSNFANYDLVSDKYLSSVKVKGLTENGEPRYSDYNKYLHDIVNPNTPANQRAASDLLTAMQDHPEISNKLPPELADASNQNEMAQAMADRSILQIPYDQVDRTRDDIYERIKKNPGEYVLDDPLTQSDLDSAARTLADERIQPIAEGQYTSHDLGKTAVDLYGQGHLAQNKPQYTDSAELKELKLKQKEIDDQQQNIQKLKQEDVAFTEPRIKELEDQLQKIKPISDDQAEEPSPEHNQNEEYNQGYGQ